MSRRHPLFASLALVGVTAVVATFSMPAAYAADGEPVVTNRETVQAYLDATGDVKVARIYDQLAAFGNGTVTVENPVSSKGLRNLNGFGGVDVEDGRAVQKLEVDGEARLRTLSDFEGDLPVDVIVAYSLNGKSVKPSDIVGKSGLVEVRYTVKNVTGEMREITYTNGAGETVNESVEVPIPLVGSLSTTLPSSFTDVRSDEAAVAGDGRGGTKLSFTMTLFPPIGSDTIEFAYAAQVEDAELPPASVSIVPVQPLQSPSFKGGAESYKGGAESGAELTAGATEIDANLLKLRDGAAELLAGLVQLKAGADQLGAGLQGEAAPGAEELSDGLGQAADGGADLRSGLGQLEDGTTSLKEGFKSSAGKPDLVSGSNTLASGLAQISNGLTQLSGSSGLPKALAGLKQLQSGIDHPVGAGGASDPGGLLQGLQQIAGGLSNPGCDPAKPTDPANPCGVKEGLAGLASSTAGLPAAKGGVAQVKAGLDDALKAGGSIDTLAGGVAAAKSTAGCTADPVCAATLTAVLNGINGTDGLRAKTTAASGGLGQVETGLGTAIAGVTALQSGVDRLAAGAASARNSVKDLILPGVNDLVKGVGTAVGGVQQLAPGATQASSGAQQLAGKIAEAGDGASKIAAGTGEAYAGSGELLDGLEQLDDGGQQLADGLGEASVGSKRLAEGLGEAATGAPEIVDGAERLSTEGTQQLVAAGEETTVDYGKRYAMIEAGAERAETEAMPYGAPEGAIGTAAYSLEIDGVTAEGSRNVQRGLGALVAFGGALGLTALVRRRLA